jgi:polysaccharide deacetylase family protein (PEP-CTERM system associated)
MPDAPRFAHRRENGLLEIPVTTLRMFDRNLPSSGGGYFRLLPYSLSRWMLKRVNATDGQPAIFYFHPWEIDHAQPRVTGTSVKTRVRHYLNLERTFDRLQFLLRDFRWSSVDRVFFADSMPAQ